MSKLSIAYIITLIIIGVLLVFTVFRPMVSVEEFTEVQRENLLKTEDGWIIELLIINREGRDTNFSIVASINGESYVENTLIPDEGAFTYIYDIGSHKFTDGEVSFCIYMDREDSPLEEITYYLK